MKSWRANHVLYGIVIGVISGVVCGCIFGEKMQVVEWLGTIFLNALKMAVIPLIFSSIVTGICQLGDIRKIGATGLKTVSYYFVTTGIAVLLGMVLVTVIKPGIGVEISSYAVPECVGDVSAVSFLDVVLGMVSPNIFKSMVDMQIMPIIVFALVFGGALAAGGKNSQATVDFFAGVNETMIRIVHLIMHVAPFGIFGLIASKFAGIGGGNAFFSEISRLGKYSFTVLAGLAIHGCLILPVILKVWGKQNPLLYAKNMVTALTTAFSTASSSATLPITIQSVEEGNRVSPHAASFVLPLGATLNMDGTALYEAVAALFIAQAYGVELTLAQQVIIFFAATLAAVGAAGIPQAGLVTMVMVLQVVNLPVEGVASILAVDWFLDRCRTTVNVWGDAVGAAVIDQTREIKALRK